LQWFILVYFDKFLNTKLNYIDFHSFKVVVRECNLSDTNQDFVSAYAASTAAMRFQLYLCPFFRYRSFFNI